MDFALHPTQRLLHGLAGWTLLGLWPAFQPDLTGFWVLIGGLLLTVAARDAFLLHRRPSLRVERHVAPALPLGVWRTVRLRVVNPHPQPATLTLFDHYPTAAAIWC